MKRTLFFLMAGLVGAVALSACRDKKDFLDEPIRTDKIQPRMAAPERTGLTLEAYAVGNRVRVHLTNYHDRVIFVGPKLFAVIPPGSRKATWFLKGIDDDLMPVKSLKKGESIQGYMRFRKFDDLVGMKLAFKSLEEDIEPVFCVIQPGSGAGTMPRPPAPRPGQVR